MFQNPFVHFKCDVRLGSMSSAEYGRQCRWSVRNVLPACFLVHKYDEEKLDKAGPLKSATPLRSTGIGRGPSTRTTETGRS